MIGLVGCQIHLLAQVWCLCVCLLAHTRTVGGYSVQTRGRAHFVRGVDEQERRKMYVDSECPSAAFVGCCVSTVASRFVVVVSYAFYGGKMQPDV
jgi:hypothetical protein